MTANMLQRTRPSGFIDPCLPSPAARPLGHTPPPLRVLTRDQLARALHARTSPMTIWDRKLAARFERLLWLQQRQWRLFAKLVDMLMEDISRDYGVKFGDDWIIGRHTNGEIILHSR
jgi:hypothetical protein